MGAVWLMAGAVLFVGRSCLAVDQTVEEKAVGADVVQAAVDLVQGSCIFSDDKLLLRRLAYVATTDGEDAHTFQRNGEDYYGGIWQVSKFRQTMKFFFYVSLS